MSYILQYPPRDHFFLGYGYWYVLLAHQRVGFGVSTELCGLRRIPKI